MSLIGLQSRKIEGLFAILLLMILMSCSKSSEDNVQSQPYIPNNTQNDDATNYANVNFSNWKLTLPVDEDNNGKPDEYQPQELINLGYQNLLPVQPYMYDVESDSSLVFYTFPASSTANSSYSRTELRELINTGNSRINWSLQDGGVMEGRLKIDEVSTHTTSNSNQFHNVIVMQIHGILSIEDMELHNFSSNNGPPLLKIYWKDGYIWSHKKSLVDENTSGDDLLNTSSDTWVDIKDNMGYVGYDAFNFKITASNAYLELQLNNEEPLIYQDISLEKWPFENYFKARNYLTTTDQEAFSYVKYYNLNISH